VNKLAKYMVKGFANLSEIGLQELEQFITSIPGHFSNVML